MNKIELELYVAIALLFSFSIYSCAKIGCPEGAGIDPAFSGQWVGNGVDLRVGHISSCEGKIGLVEAHGINNSQDATWDLLAFSGSVTMVGVARGDVNVWGADSEGNRVIIAEFIMDLVRSDDTITLNLDPLQESYQLLKQ